MVNTNKEFKEKLRGKLKTFYLTRQSYTEKQRRISQFLVFLIAIFSFYISINLNIIINNIQNKEITIELTRIGESANKIEFISVYNVKTENFIDTNYFISGNLLYIKLPANETYAINFRSNIYKPIFVIQKAI